MKTASALLPLLFAAPALAEEPAATTPGRYQFQPVEGGLARLDTATGEIAICRVDPARMTCEPGAAPTALAPLPPAVSDGDEAEFDRALERMKRVFRAFGDIAREFDQGAPGTLPDRT